jgi:hypothetical protein
MSDRDPKIRFGGREIPTYEAWAKLAVARGALDVLTRFNQGRASLATDLTRDTEGEVRRRLGSLEILMPEAPSRELDLEDRVRALLLTHSPDRVLDILKREHKVDCDYNGLIHLAGSETYLKSLAIEAHEFQDNRISDQQIADLWNEAKRPALGKPFWDRIAVRELLRGGTSDSGNTSDSDDQ